MNRQLISCNSCRCYVPGYDDDTTDYSTPFNSSNDVAQYLFPPAKTDSGAQVYCYYCNVSFIGAKQNCTKQLATNKCARKYVYDKSQYHSTIISEVK